MPYRRPMTALLILAVLAASRCRLLACDTHFCTCMAAVTVEHACQGAWHIASTANFQVCSLTSDAEAERVARRCEQVRRDLIGTWGLVASVQPWNPKCQVILHRTTGNYGAAVGGAFAATYGSSLVKPSTGTIAVRRIDLRTNVEDYLAGVLPHELCHVLLADRFRDQAAPLWYDEGIALLADTEAKQLLHERDLHDGFRRHVEFSVADLVTAQQYPPPDRMGVFYGQCAALTHYLRQLGSAEQFHEFAIRIGEVGVNFAARECYGFSGAGDLENNWRQNVIEKDKLVTARVLPVRHSGPRIMRLSASDQP